MLLQLNILNFALIEKLTVDFQEGFNALSGETGAGKSILIDAIGYVLGNKFNKSLIRTGEDRTYVEAIFALKNEKTKKVLEDLEIEYDDLVIISRETFQSGKSVAKVNGKALLLSKLKLVSQTLLDIHGQHENQNLLDKANHITYVDLFGELYIDPILKQYKENYHKVAEIQNKISSLVGEEGEREKRIDFLKYQMEEIHQINPKINEDKELEEQYTVLSNAEKLEKVLHNSYTTLYNGEEMTPSIFDGLGMVIKDLKGIQEHLSAVTPIVSALEESYYNIEQTIADLRDLKTTIYYDEKELEYLHARLYHLGICKKKYGETIEEVLAYNAQITEQYEALVNSEEAVRKLHAQKNNIEATMEEQAKALHEERKRIAKALETKIQAELADVGLEKSTFVIEIVSQEEFTPLGKDKVQFNISTNPGEPLQPLEAIVSGGELSRIMLALKTVFVDKDAIPSVIFDEIDTGISGRIAQSVAEKMYAISKQHQVFCVTHLPQIASMADKNYLIKKEVIENKTYTKVHPMSEEEKQQEVARMIGGIEVTDLTLKNAKEMIELGNKKKLRNEDT